MLSYAKKSPAFSSEKGLRIILPTRASPSLNSEENSEYIPRQVFWLPDQPTGRTFPIASSDQWLIAAFVPGYSGVPVSF